MRGRLPSGPEVVSRLDGSAEARERLRLILEVLAGTCRAQDACRLLGLSGTRLEQLRRRALLARRQAVAAARLAQEHGCSQSEAARRLGVSPRSLRRWASRTAPWVPRGRPVRPSSPTVRQQVIAQLAEWGPRTGVPALRAAFPDV